MEQSNNKTESILKLLWSGIFILVVVVVIGLWVFPYFVKESPQSVLLDDYNKNNFEDVISGAKYSKEVSSQLILAASYLQQGGFNFDEIDGSEKALAVLNKILESDPKNAEALRLSAYAYELIGQYDKAIELYSQALVLSPNNPVIISQQGHAYSLKGDEKSARAAIMAAYKLLPGDTLVAQNAARIFLADGDVEKAEEIYIQVANAKDASVRLRAEANYSLSSIYIYYLPNIEKSLAAANEAIKVDPSYYLGYIGKARALSAKKDGMAAFEEVKKAINLHKNSALAYEWLGILYFNRSQYKESVESFAYAATVLNLDNTIMPLDRPGVDGRMAYYIAVNYSKQGTSEFPNPLFNRQKAVEALKIALRNIDVLTYGLMKDDMLKGTNGQFAALVGMKDYDAMVASLKNSLNR